MEFLDDIEKRILLSAISREKKVCEQVDNESYREPYKPILTDVCKSLEYKFMYDRLFKQIYEQGKADAIDECIKALDDYIEFPMTDEYVIRECISVLRTLKEKKE